MNFISWQRKGNFNNKALYILTKLAWEVTRLILFSQPRAAYPYNADRAALW